MAVKVLSFSYRDFEAPEAAGLVIDCRRLPNPYRDPDMRPMTGKDERVQRYLLETGEAQALADETLACLHEKPGSVVAFGCHGGRHRSVAMAEMFAATLRDQGYTVDVEHLALKA